MRRNERHAPVVGALPREWERETTFHDQLFDWMHRAPWLALSALAHALLFLILLAIPWDLLEDPKEVVLVTTLEPEQVEPFDPPEPETVEPLDEPVPEEPQLQDADVDEPLDDAPPVEGDPDFTLDSSFPVSDFATPLGLGGGGDPKLGGRFGRGGGRGRGGRGTEQAVEDGLAWLAAHQSDDGRWDSDGFMGRCGEIGPTICGGPGQELHDVGMTGLALLAFLGDGNTTREGRYREQVARGVKWLKDQQDPDTGLIGERIGHAFLYDHAIGSLALCEAYYFSKSPLLKASAQGAVNYILRARNPYSGWRYQVPPDGESDTSVTGWMVFALKSAEEGGLAVDRKAYAGALSWLDQVTDPATGRVGYDARGALSSRILRVNDHFPREKAEAMTAVGLLCRFFLGQDPAQTPVMEQHAELLLAKLPEWDPDGFGCDMYAWYYGSYAMFQMGGSRYWEPWNKALKKAVVQSQRKDGDEKGSWDPVGPWGYAGGRVYATSLMVLCLQVYYRYGRILGAR